MIVREVMTKDVVTIDRDETVLDGCKKYQKHRVGCLIVIDKEFPVGIITERDIIEKIILTNKNPKKTKIEDIMSSNLKTIHASAKIEDAAEMMKKNRIKKLPVVLNNRIAGIITVTDISNVLPDFSRRGIQEAKSVKLV